MRCSYSTITPLFEEQDSGWREGNRSIHRHHSGGIWSEEALHLMFVSCREAELHVHSCSYCNDQLRGHDESPVVCWEKIGEARNLRNPQWNTNSFLNLMGSVLLGCLLTKTCITDICLQRGKREESVNIKQPVQSVWLCVTWTDLLLMRQERHQGQRSACLHAVHHRWRYVDDMKRNKPAHLKHKNILYTWNRHRFTQPVICFFFTMAPSSSAAASAKMWRRVRSKFWNWKMRE